MQETGRGEETHMKGYILCYKLIAEMSCFGRVVKGTWENDVVSMYLAEVSSFKSDLFTSFSHETTPQKLQSPPLSVDRRLYRTWRARSCMLPSKPMPHTSESCSWFYAR